MHLLFLLQLCLHLLIKKIKIKNLSRTIQKKVNQSSLLSIYPLISHNRALSSAPRWHAVFHKIIFFFSNVSHNLSPKVIVGWRYTLTQPSYLHDTTNRWAPINQKTLIQSLTRISINSRKHKEKLVESLVKYAIY